MKKLLIGASVAIASLFIGGDAIAQNYSFCNTDSGVYRTRTLYEYGEGPVLYDRELDGYDSVIVLSPYQWATMQSHDGLQYRVYNGEEVFIAGLFYNPDCSLQLMIYHYDLDKAGFIPANVVAVP